MTQSGRKRYMDLLYLALGLMAVVAVALWMGGRTEAQLLEHSAFDSYTKQAMAWRDGRIALDQNYPWLELAVYGGDYYVSFPPVPTIPMWLLSFLFGENTPSGLVTLLYFLGAYVVLFLLCRRYLNRGQATGLAVFTVLGGSLLDLAVSGHGFSGGVWYQAQLLGLLLTALAYWLVDGQGRRGWAVGLVCIALAVGCRPLNAVHVPLLLWMLYRKVNRPTPLAKLGAMIPYVIVPACVACAYGVYNYVRFGNPFEFGHSYLPEYAQAGEWMFVPGRIWEHLRVILRPPEIRGGMLTFPVISGFAVYLTNPLLVMAAGRGLERVARGRRVDSVGVLLAVTLVVHGALLLTQRVNGGWQYGTRYLCDLLPGAAYAFARGGRSLRRWECALMGGLVVFNVYGSIVFHYL